MFFADNADDPQLATVSDALSGMRGQMDVRAVNANENAGLFLRFRAEGSAITAGEGFMNYAFGWVSFFDRAFTLYGGNIDRGYFNSLDRMSDADMGEGHGFYLVLRPMRNNNLMFNYGAFVPPTGALLNNNTAKNVVALSYTMPDTFIVRAGFRNANRVGGGYGAWTRALLPGTNPVVTGTQTSAAYLSFQFLGMPDGMHLSASAFVQTLEEFGDSGDMRFFLSYGYNGLADGRLDLRLNGAFGMTMAETIAPLPDPAPWVWIWASADYAVNDTVVPRIDLHYVMGGRANESNAQNVHWRDQIRNSVSYNKDDSFFRVQPSVQFRITPSTYTELGAIVHLDTGDNATWRIPVAGASTGPGTDFALYALLRVTF